MTTETFEFQVEARQLLQMMIHSIYSNKDVFLRELVSNASDALDKLRLEALRDHDLEADISDLHISLDVDAEARTLTVRDNGIGMSHDEVVQLIGTIAKSGTASFLAELKEAKDSAAAEELIGQFGIGFYSTFMVADQVTLVTRRAGEKQGTRWTSSGAGTYQIEAVDEAPQGTAITLQLKAVDTEDHLYDYTAHSKIREIVKRYSDFITWPIRMAPPAPAPAPAPAPSQSADDEAKDSADSTEEPPAPAEPETLNSMKALWARPSSEVSEEEYHELYKHISHDWIDPLEHLHMRAEGTFEYQAVLFFPSHAPHDLFSRNTQRGLQLYAKRVFIMDNCEALLPEYLRFVKGVVDAQDLSLNVSREILQQDRQIQLMHRRLGKKVLATIKEMKANRPENYQTFWREFGQALKEGLLSDFENREAILQVTSFASTHDGEALTGLAEYLERMPEDQEHIYYLTGESRAAIEHSPHLEAFRDKGYEVLMLTDPVDEIWVTSVPDFQGKQLRSVAKGEAELESEESAETKSEREKRQQEFSDFLQWMSETLKDDVKEVRLSSRLTVSPACIVSDANDATPALQNIYRAMGQELPASKRILEVNADHALIGGLRRAQADGGDAAELAETAELVYHMALLAEGGQSPQPARFTQLMADRLARTL
uniref:Chaperone protein HtpG n=1 Tax=Streptomyces sp. CNQ-418 TaxID=467194 RepID=J7GY84_9ACTN|nr:hsp90-like protein [Streptomyces sp. CNQ-418]